MAHHHSQLCGPSACSSTPVRPHSRSVLEPSPAPKVRGVASVLTYASCHDTDRSVASCARSHSARSAVRAPRSRSHPITFSRCVPRPCAASSAVPCAYSGSQFKSAPWWRRNSAARRWPAPHACQNAWLTCSAVGGGRPSMSSRSRSTIPSPAAVHRLSTRAPRSTSNRATFQQPYPIAFSSGVPIEPFGMLMSVPPSIKTRATSLSSLLAAQCKGVSAPGCGSRAFGSPPAASSLRAICGPFGK